MIESINLANKKIVAIRKSSGSSRSNYQYPQAPPPYSVAQGNFHTAHPQMPQIRIRDDNLRLHVANCYIDRQKVKLGSRIKEGNFGVVFKAKWHISEGGGYKFAYYCSFVNRTTECLVV